MFFLVTTARVVGFQMSQCPPGNATLSLDGAAPDGAVLHVMGALMEHRDIRCRGNQCVIPELAFQDGTNVTFYLSLGGVDGMGWTQMKPPCK